MAWSGAKAVYWNNWSSDSSIIADAEFYEENINNYLIDTGEAEVIDNNNGTYIVKYLTNEQHILYTFIMDEDGKATMTEREFSKMATYLVDKVVIGDYISINFNGNLGNYSAGWRVLSKSGKGRKGVVTLISAESPLYYKNNAWETNTAYMDLNDLSHITITNEGKGFKIDNITGATSGDVDLLSCFGNNKYFDSSKGIHAFGCNTQNDGTISGTNREFETLYEYITGASSIKMSDLGGKYLTDTYLSTQATINGKTMDTKCAGLFASTGYYLGGAPYRTNCLWLMYSNAGLTFESISGNGGVRPVISLKPGVKVSDDNVGTGVVGSPITLK